MCGLTSRGAAPTPSCPDRSCRVSPHVIQNESGGRSGCPVSMFMYLNTHRHTHTRTRGSPFYVTASALLPLLRAIGEATVYVPLGLGLGVRQRSPPLAI